jgi:hypothetical protein
MVRKVWTSVGLEFSARHSHRPLIRAWFRPDGMHWGGGLGWSRGSVGLPHSVGLFEVPVGYPTNPGRVLPLKDPSSVIWGCQLTCRRGGDVKEPRAR